MIVVVLVADMSDEKIRVIVYSESLGFNYLLKNYLNSQSFLEVIEFVDNPKTLDGQLRRNKDTLVLLCASMVSFVNIISVFEILETNGSSCVAVCDTTNLSFSMMRKGALSTVILRDNADDAEISIFFKNLKVKLRDANKLKSVVKLRTLKQEVSVRSRKIVVFGSSTGGTEAILSILKELPAEIPPTLIVQHMPSVFTKMYAERLNSVCKATVWEAKDGDILRPGLVLIAPGDMQMRVVKKGMDYAVTCKKEGRVNGVEPSADVLFDSVYENVTNEVIAVILTGMGSDGAKGMLKLREKGAFTIGQDERSCVVYGMPKVAYDIGAVKVQVPLSKIGKTIMENI